MKFKNLLDIASVHTGKSNTVDALENGEYPFFDRSQKIKKSNKYLFDERAIIIPGEGKEFIPRYFEGKYDLHQRAYAIVPHIDEIGKFIYYAILYSKKHFEKVAVGTTVKSLRLASFEIIDIPYPSKKEQISIVNILSLLDNKIENNNAIISNLESQAQTIFKSWFIDFEPFQDGEFVDSELGRIPEGWKVKSIKELCNRRNGFTYKSSELADESETNMLNLKSFNRNGGINFESEKPIILNDRVKEFHYLYKGDILIACTDLTQNADVIGRSISYIKNYKFNQEIFSMDLVKIEPKKEIWRTYLFYYLSSSLFKRYAESVATGTTVLHFPKDAIDDFQLLLPSSDIIKSFSNIVKGVIDIKENFIYQNVNLAQLRDILLPKLMSGEIRVGEDNLEELETEI